MLAVEMGWRGWNSSKLKLWHNNIDLNKAMFVVLEKERVSMILFLKSAIEVYQILMLGYDKDKIIFIMCELAVQQHNKSL